MSESSRSPSVDRTAKPVREVGLGDLGGRRLAGAPPGLDAAVEDVQPLLREPIEPHEPVAADGLPVEPDVVVEDDPVALADPPSTEDVGDELGGRDEPLALGVAGLGGRALERELLVEVAVGRARDVPLVVDAPVGRDVDEPDVGVVEVLGQPRRRRRAVPDRSTPRRRTWRGRALRLVGLGVVAHRPMLAGYPAAMTTTLAHARAAVPGPRREVRLGAASAAVRGG